MTTRNRVRPAHHAQLVLLAALIALATLGPTSELATAEAAARPATISTARPAASTVGTVRPDEQVAWRDAAALLDLARPAPATGRRDAGYRLPQPDAVVRATFEAPDAPWARGHRGVDLEAVVGAPVLAPQDGVVRFTGTVVDRRVVTIEHADGLRSSLEPVLAEVEVGSRVRAGQALGTVQAAASHCRPLSCVHWGVRRGTAYLDPLGLLPGSGPVVLLPVPHP